MPVKMYGMNNRKFCELIHRLPRNMEQKQCLFISKGKRDLSITAEQQSVRKPVDYRSRVVLTVFEGLPLWQGPQRNLKTVVNIITIAPA